MAPAALRTLPPELHAAICSHLCWHCVTPSWPESPDYGRRGRREGQADLLSLSRVSRLLYAAAEPFFYHWPYLSREWDLFFLLRTLADRPDLAANVSYLDLGPINKLPLISQASSGTIGPKLRAVLEALQQSSHDIPQPQNSAALIRSALQLIPNLRRLHLRLLDNVSAEPLLWMSASSSSVSSASLKTLAFSGLGHGNLLDQVAPIIQRAPNLEILYCYYYTRVTEIFDAALNRGSLAEPPPMQNLTELALVDTFITASSFRNLLTAIGPKLSKVHVRRTARQPDDPFDPIHILEFDEALAALQPWRLTLEELSFVTISGRALPQPGHRLRAIHILPEFSALKALRAQAGYFDFYGRVGPGKDTLRTTLPASVRELRLLGYSQLAQGLQGFVEAVTAGQFVHLCLIEIDDQGFDQEPAREQELLDVGASFRSAGVAFTVRPIDHFGPDTLEELEFEDM